MTFDPQAIEQAADALSLRGQLHFTLRNLYYQLVRDGVLEDPAGTPDETYAAFEARWSAYCLEHAAPSNLVDRDALVDSLEGIELPDDIFDYAVRRVLVFQSTDGCLAFIRNGFHRKIETGLVATPRFPSHVWERIGAQLDMGIRTTLYAVHDCSVPGMQWLSELRRGIGRRKHAVVKNVGLNFPWAFRLRMPVRTLATPPAYDPKGSGQWNELLERGDYAQFEELPPILAMRWVYRRIARAAEDIGFG